MNPTPTKYVTITAAIVAVGALVLTDRQTAMAQPPVPPPTAVRIVSPLPLPVTGGLIVKNLDERGRNPYFQRVHCESPTSNGCSGDTPPIPAGRRLVLEHVNASAQVLNGGTIQSLSLFINGVAVADLQPLLISNSSGTANYVANDPTLLYVEAGDVITLAASSFSVTNINASVRLSGYLVDLAQ